MKKIHFYIITLTVVSLAQAQFKKGFGFTTGARGSVFIIWVIGSLMRHFSGFELKFIDVKNDGEMPAINYYTGQTFNIGDDA